MPTTKDLLYNSTVKSLLTSVRRTVGTTAGSVVDLKGIGRKLLVIVDAGGFGASATLGVIIQECSTSTGVFTTLHPVITLDAVATRVADMAPSQQFVRAYASISSTTIDFAVEGIIYLERERPSGL